MLCKSGSGFWGHDLHEAKIKLKISDAVFHAKGNHQGELVVGRGLSLTVLIAGSVLQYKLWGEEGGVPGT